MVCQRCRGVERQEEEVLDDDWGARKERRGEGRVFFETGPAEVDVEEEEEDAESND